MTFTFAHKFIVLKFLNKFKFINYALYVLFKLTSYTDMKVRNTKIK